MKQFIVSAFFMLAFFSNVSAEQLDLKINGVGLETKESIALSKLGEPSSRRRGGIVPCSDGVNRLELRYPGLEIELYRDPDEKEFSVYSLRVTSSKWFVNEINVGATIIDIQKKFGEPYLKRNEKSILGIYYNLAKGLGAAEFYFRRNKLNEIYWEFNFC